MTGVFSQILNMSLTASVVILLLLLLRLPFKQAPKVISYALWGIVLIRLVCPVSLPSPASLFSWTEAPAVEAGQTMSAISYLPTVYPTAEPEAAITAEADAAEPAPAPQSSKPDVREIAAWIWLAGALILAAWAAAAYFRLLLRLRSAVPLGERVYLAEQISTPFVLGLLRPRIYLPADLQEGERDYILLHERLHIRRGDHVTRLLAYGALCLHWFNPLVWLAYVLSGRDMEMACDEAVVKKLGAEIRADYAASILSLATGRKLAMPLAFGAGDPKGRIRNLARWKRPALWGILAAVLACAVLAVCLLTNPAPRQEEAAAPRFPEAQLWFDEYESDAFPWDGIREINLDAFPGVTFRWRQEQVTAVTDEETTPLYSGMPIWSVYFADLTGDGLPELCSTVSYGSGEVDDRVIIYDYAGGASYTLEDRGEYDYVLSLENGKLWVTQYAYNTKTVASRGYLTFEDGALQLKPQPQETGLTPGTYVPYQCIYLNPASSFYPFGGDSGFVYEVGEDRFSAVYRGGGQVAAVDDHPALDTAGGYPASTLAGIRWNWQPFPYTDEEWKELCLFDLGTMEDFPQQHQEILYQPLSALSFLLRVDGDLWLVELQDDGQRQFLWSIYSLAPETAMGIAQWEYAPALSERSTCFPIALPGTYTSASCQGGSVVALDDGFGWSPVEDGALAEAGTLRFTLETGGEAYEGTLYFTASGGTDGRQVYTASLTGTGLTLSPNGMGEGGVIALAGGVQPVFWANFAGNTSFSQKLMLTERAPCWEITVTNTGAQAILMELEGAVYRIEANTEKTIASEEPWEPGTYAVSFASAGVEGMEGEVLGVRTARPGTSAAMPYDLSDGALTCPVEELTQYVFGTNTTKLTVTVSGGVGELTLVDISQGGEEILYGRVDGENSTCTFSNLTASRRYQVAWTGTADCTVTVSDGT